MYLNCSRVASVDGWVGGEEGGTGGSSRVLKDSHSSSLQNARVTEYSGRAVEKGKKLYMTLLPCNRTPMQNRFRPTLFPSKCSLIMHNLNIFHSCSVGVSTSSECLTCRALVETRAEADFRLPPPVQKETLSSRSGCPFQLGWQLRGSIVTRPEQVVPLHV